MTSGTQSSRLLKAAILIISDTASQDPSTDKSAEALKTVFEQEGSGNWETASSAESSSNGIEVKIVPDKKDEIENAITAWTDSRDRYVNLIVTTGGTGFTPKDNTPEAVGPLLHRQAPGLVHGMLTASLQVTPFAMMSRPVAGVRNKTIILTLPGSPKGARENLQAVLKLLPHACLQAAGEDSRAAHAGGVQKLEKEAGVAAGATSQTKEQSHSHNHDYSHTHSHSHSHKHDHGSHNHGHKVPKAHTTPSERPAPQSNDPRLGASHRARQSPYPMLEVPDAISLILQHTPSPTPITKPLSPSLVGSIISTNIKAAEAVPAYRASIVDGYAVIVPSDPSDRKSLKGTFPVASISHAQASSMPPPLQQGQIARITTGAPLPEGANAVVMVEDTVVANLRLATATDADGNSETDKEEEKEVTILTDALAPGENIREPGSDIQPGTTILRAGDRISPLGGEIGLLAASGTREVPVYRRARIGVLSTGDEVTDVSYSGALTGGMIRDSNRPSLLALISSWQLCEEVVDLGIARDTPHHELETKLRDAYRMHDLDVVVTTGGVSMGELDLLKPTIERSLGGTIHFGRVNMKPGKPTTFASMSLKSTLAWSSSGTGQGERTTKLIFALPGNPASALVTAQLFLLPSLQKLAGFPLAQCKGLEKVTVWLAGRVKCDKARPEYHRVVVGMDRDNGTLVARSTGVQRSSRVGSFGGGDGGGGEESEWRAANGLLCLPAKEGWLEAWESCECLLMGGVYGW